MSGCEHHQLHIGERLRAGRTGDRRHALFQAQCKRREKVRRAPRQTRTVEAQTQEAVFKIHWPRRELMNHQKPPLSKVQAISESRDVSRFDCGDHESLNDWLKRFALTNQRNESARTYVVHRNSLVVGYYSISAGSVSVEESPARIPKGLARHAIPVILLARLAVDRQ